MHRFRYLLDTLITIKRIALFLFVVLIGVAIYFFLFRYTFVDKNLTLGIAALWIMTAYIALPRVHRILSKIYLPNYYIGRATTSEGILGDPVNLAIIGSAEQLKNTMINDGWVEADDLNIKSTLKMIGASLARKSYPSAPVSSLFLFTNKQSFAFQKEVGGRTSKRHHVRFWKTPEGWILPGGFTCDWIGAATYDRKVGFSLFTFQITHKIEPDTDVERDYVVASMRRSNKSTKVKVVKNFSTGYHTVNGGGDTITTDGALPFVTIGK